MDRKAFLFDVVVAQESVNGTVHGALHVRCPPKLGRMLAVVL